MRAERSLLLGLLFPIILLVSQVARAQVCDAEQIIQVCELESPTTFIFNPQATSLGTLNFRVISKREKKNDKPQAVKYRVKVTETSSTQFTLASASGDLVDVTLSYANFDGSVTALTHDVQSSQQNGNTTFGNASIIFALAAPGVQPPPGVYLGTFQMDLEQSAGCGSSGCETFVTTFDVELVVEASIRISGLEDMLINYPSNIATQSFCVFTSAGLEFGIRAESMNGNGEFLLLGTGGTGDTVVYAVDSGEVNSTLAPLTEGQTTLDQGLTWPGNPSQDCVTDGENMQLQISIDPAALNNARESQYTDTITLTVELP